MLIFDKKSIQCCILSLKLDNLLSAHPLLVNLVMHFFYRVKVKKKFRCWAELACHSVVWGSTLRCWVLQEFECARAHMRIPFTTFQSTQCPTLFLCSTQVDLVSKKVYRHLQLANSTELSRYSYSIFFCIWDHLHICYLI